MDFSRKVLYQAAVFIVAYINYSAIYLTRKPLSVVKATLTTLGVPVWALGVYDSLFLLIYALGQFVAGWASEKFGSRVVILASLLISALSTFLMGFVGLELFSFSTNVLALMLGLFWSLNGVGQSLGWCPCVKVLSLWCEEDLRGTVFGFYATCCTAGSFLGTVLAVNLLSALGWQYAMMVPAMILLVIAFADLFVWYAEPSVVGIEIPKTSAAEPKELIVNTNSSDAEKARELLSGGEDTDSENLRAEMGGEMSSSSEEGVIASTVPSVQPTAGIEIVPFEDLKDTELDVFPGEDQMNKDFLRDSQPEKPADKSEDFFYLRLIYLCLFYFGIKFVLYTLLFWTPFYLTTQLNYTESASGYIAVAFDIGGFLGSISNGFFSDQIGDHRLLALSICCFFGAVSIVMFFVLGGYGQYFAFVTIFFIGFFNLACDTMMTIIGAESSDVKIVGLLNGFGTLGAFVQAFLIPIIASYSDWQHVMIFLCMLAFSCYILSLPMLFIQYLRAK